MSQQDNFSSGFLVGAIVGGLLGGAVGALLTAKRPSEPAEEPLLKPDLADPKAVKQKRRPLRAATEQNMEVARRSLEDKIAQLNEAIDDVRQQLSSVNGRAHDGDEESSLAEES